MRRHGVGVFLVYPAALLQVRIILEHEIPVSLITTLIAGRHLDREGSLAIVRAKTFLRARRILDAELDAVAVENVAVLLLASGAVFSGESLSAYGLAHGILVVPVGADVLVFGTGSVAAGCA